MLFFSKFCIYLLQTFLNVFAQFSLSFFSRLNNNFVFIFLKIDKKCCSIFSIITYKLWAYHWLNAQKRTEMVDCNDTSLMIFVNDAKHIHLVPILLTCLIPITSRVWAFCKIIQILLTLLQIIVTLFVSNRIIDILYY